MALNGDLNDMSLVDLIEVFQIGAKSGVLYLSEGTNLGLLYVASGQVIDAVVLTWPERITTLISDAALAAVLQWKQAKFIFHHQLVDRPVVIGRAVVQTGAEPKHSISQSSVPRICELETVPNKAQTTPVARHNDMNARYPARGARVPTHLSSDYLQRTTAVPSRWSLDLEPFMQTSKPTSPEKLSQPSFYMPPQHRQVRAHYGAVRMARTKLIATVIQRIREL